MDALKHVTDIILPLFEERCHRSVLIQSILGVVLDRTELFKCLLVRIIDVMDFFFIDKAFDTLVYLLFV